jgi:hypothetical protein
MTGFDAPVGTLAVIALLLILALVGERSDRPRRQ